MNQKENHLWKSILEKMDRKALMFLVGATIALHETFVGISERPFLLALAGGLMGLPFVISADQKRNGGEGEKRS